MPDELQRMWQSQPVQPMPSFALLDDVAMTPRLPYSREDRVWVALSRLLVGMNFLLQWRHSLSDLDRAGIAVGFVGGLATAVFVLRQKDRSPGMDFHLSVEEHRARFRRELVRQAAIERRELLFLWITFVIACTLIGVARGEPWLPVLGFVLIFGESWRRRKLQRFVDSSSSSS